MTGKRRKFPISNPNARDDGTDKPTEESAQKQTVGDTSIQSTLAHDLECPAGLPPLAREEWNRIVSELVELGVLSRFDRGPLAIYCGAYAAWAEKPWRRCRSLG